MIDLQVKPESLIMDFDGVLTDNFVHTDSNGVESVRCSKLDSLGLSLLKKELNFYVAVVTSETNKSPVKRCEKLDIECFSAVRDKRLFLQELADRKGINLKKSIFVGNDIVDLGALEIVGIPIIVADAHHSLLGRGFLTTSCAGGMGAIREVADAILTTYRN